MKSLYVLLMMVFVLSATHSYSKDPGNPAGLPFSDHALGKDFSVFSEVPLSWVKPEGWLKTVLQLQKDGLTGHIEVAGFPFTVSPWQNILTEKDTDPVAANWWPYEQTGYWVDGALKCGYLLNDKELTDRARKNIIYVLDHPAPNGELGPQSIKSRWPQAVFFRALMAEYSETKNPEIIKAMVKHYLHNATNYSKGRDVMNVENICWLYLVTGDDRILKRAEGAYHDFCEKDTSTVSMKSLLSDDVPDIHGVTFNETLKLPVILYQATGNPEYLRAAQNGFDKLDKYHVMVDGMPTSSEKLYGSRSNYIHETCNVSDYSWSTGYMLMATGDTRWADRIEQVCFNAGMGSVTKDFKAHQYYSSPNQVIATNTSCHWNADEEWYIGSKDRMTFRPGQSPKCCSGNVNRIIPNYVSRMWMTGKNGEIVAAMFGPTKLTFPVKNTEVTIEEKTDYPFSEKIDFLIQTTEKVQIPLVVRIPGWCKNASLLLNGKKIQSKLKAGTFVKLEQTFVHGDVVSLLLPMDIFTVITAEHGIAVRRGPLVYALLVKAKEKKEIKNRTNDEQFPSYEMTPASSWSFALSPAEIEKKAVVTKNKMPENPWYPETTPVKITLPAREINNWNLEKGHTPALPLVYDIKGEKEIELVPLGCTKLRIAVFPDAKLK